jgi:hypothetical protein
VLGKATLASRIVEAGGKLRVRSALNPVLWLCAIITVPCLFCMPFVPRPPTWLVFLGCAPVATAVFGFLFLLFFDRDKLQSEDYQIRKRSLELIQQKGEAEPRLVRADAIEAIANPDIRTLEAGREEELK